MNTGDLDPWPHLWVSVLVLSLCQVPLRPQETINSFRRHCSQMTLAVLAAVPSQVSLVSLNASSASPGVLKTPALKRRQRWIWEDLGDISVGWSLNHTQNHPFSGHLRPRWGKKLAEFLKEHIKFSLKNPGQIPKRQVTANRWRN
jgi:hypothetical protein